VTPVCHVCPAAQTWQLPQFISVAELASDLHTVAVEIRRYDMHGKERLSRVLDPMVDNVTMASVYDR
jgi:hypothetical protein